MTEWRILHGDVREQLRELPDASVQTCVTSPPYWGLRDYGHDGQIGLEPTPDAFVAAMVEVFRDVKRALRDDGTLWLNIGDSYNNRAKVRETSHQPALNDFEDDNWAERAARGGCRMSINDGTLKEKDLVGIPWAVAFALRADGWYLRSDIIWHKPNPMPESVTDRPTKAHEYLFLLSKSASYYYDADAIAEPLSPTTSRLNGLRPSEKRGGFYHPGEYGERGAQHGRELKWKPEDGRNARSVWTITTQPYPEAHFATFPEELPTRCILAGSKTGDVVLDPFAGSGTTGAVAVRLGRSFIGVELNQQYVELARRRVGGANPLFASEA